MPVQSTRREWLKSFDFENWWWGKPAKRARQGIRFGGGGGHGGATKMWITCARAVNMVCTKKASLDC